MMKAGNGNGVAFILGIGTGVVVGAGMGLATGNPAIGAGIAVVLGVTLGMLFRVMRISAGTVRTGESSAQPRVRRAA